jgi:UDP-N-acetylmuramate dehydrogenase
VSEFEVVSAAAYAREQGIRLFVLGGGSNVLISDDGFDGLVLQIALQGITRDIAGGDKVRLTAAAGEDWDGLVAHCVQDDLAGVECLSGIPGFVGGTPVQNVGAYGQEVSETITSVKCFDRTTGETVTLTNADCGFSYRTSIFNSTQQGRYIVLAVTFDLVSGGSPRVAYRDLADLFTGRQPSLAEVREAVLAIRRSKSMVIDEADPNSKCAGSFFKNPVVGWEKLKEIEADNGPVPHFKFEEKVKIPAAWLIGESGFQKGYVEGNAGISTKHNLALINRSAARAGDIIALHNKIRDAVEARFGIILTPEPVFVGFEPL